MSSSDIEMDAADRAKFARGGVFLLLGGLLVIALAIASVDPTPSLYAGLVGGSLALVVAYLVSREPVLRAVWFAPGVAAVGVGVADFATLDQFTIGAIVAVVGVIQLVTAGQLKNL